MGEGIPEPLPEPTEWITERLGGGMADLAERITLDEPVTTAFLAVLKSTSPAERFVALLTRHGQVAPPAGRTTPDTRCQSPSPTMRHGDGLTDHRKDRT